MRTFIVAFLIGCSPAPYVPPPGSVPPDAGVLPPGSPDGGCFGNNDGIIARDELQLAVGLHVTYLVQTGTASQPVPVNPAGTNQNGVTVWDLSQAGGTPTPIALQPNNGWYAGSFPAAGYITTTDIPTQTLGAFTVTDTGLSVLGYASTQMDQTLLVYDHPLELLKFPIALNQSYQVQGSITNGKVNGVPFASLDTYKVQVDAIGTLVLSFLRLDHTLRVRTDYIQSLPGGFTTTRTQYGFYHECFGEVARMTSFNDELNANFTGAAELRVLAAP